MIPLRNLAKQQRGLIRLLASSDFLWDHINHAPDFYCSSISDFKENSEKIRDGRSVRFESLRYFPLDGHRFQLTDQTGAIEASLIYDVDRLERFFDITKRQELAALNKGDKMYDVSIRRRKGSLIVFGFDTKGPAGYDSAKDDYLTLCFQNW
jgi:hypothetical protein